MKTFSNRHVKVVASFSAIVAIQQDIPLGKNRTEISLELRQAMFIKSVFFNF